jgi:hypothetical protein
MAYDVYLNSDFHIKDLKFNNTTQNSGSTTQLQAYLTCKLILVSVTIAMVHTNSDTSNAT